MAAFHSVQHLVSDRDLVTFLRAVRRALEPGGWLAFDVFAPARSFLARDENRRWDRTPFRDPTTGKRLIYTINHHLDRRRRALLMRMYYLPVDERGRAIGPERVRRLCHRQLARRRGPRARRARRPAPDRELVRLHRHAAPRDSDTEQHIYLARPA